MRLGFVYRFAVTRRGEGNDTGAAPTVLARAEPGAGPRLITSIADRAPALSTSAAKSRSPSTSPAKPPRFPVFLPPPLTRMAARRSAMAQDTPAAAAGGGTLVIPGEMAARIDRLPRSWVHWEICLLVILSWATTASTDGIAARLYPFVWIPNHAGISQSEYSWLFALEGGISILLGGYALGWLSDKIGLRKALILSVLLAAAFIWPFGYVTNYPALVLLSIADTLGFAGVLAINVVYVSEMTGPAVRAKVTLYSQALAIFVFYVILTGLIPHYMFPSQYRAYLFVLTGVNVLMALALAWRMPESPRWLEARERHDEARKIMERIEARVKKHHVLPEPDLTPYEVVAEEQPKWWAPFGKQYLVTTVFLLVVMVLGYGGIVYGFGGYAILFLSESRGYGAGFVFALRAWAAWPPPPPT